jgi:hypothetical protein
MCSQTCDVVTAGVIVEEVDVVMTTVATLGVATATLVTGMVPTVVAPTVAAPTVVTATAKTMAMVEAVEAAEAWTATLRDAMTATAMGTVMIAEVALAAMRVRLLLMPTLLLLPAVVHMMIVANVFLLLVEFHSVGINYLP